MSRSTGILRVWAPAAHRCLSEYGRRVSFPRGILAQAQEAQEAEFRATIGQMTTTDGFAQPLSSLSDQVRALSREQAFLYSPPGGFPQLRQLWAERQGQTSADHTPVVTAGITGGLSALARLFCDKDTDLVLPSPYWGNYKAIFQEEHSPRVVTFPFFNSMGQFNVTGLYGAMGEVRNKAVVVMNFPGNPTGYMPLHEEIPEIVSALLTCKKPLVIICDDAYEGWTYDEKARSNSLYWALRPAINPYKQFLVKADGVSKSLLFFGGRVGFLRFGCAPEAGEAMEDKVNAITRATMSVPPSISQAVVMQALRDHRTPLLFQQRVSELRKRWEVLDESLKLLEPTSFKALPGNSGFFRLLRCPDGVRAEDVRQALLDLSVGLVAVDERHLRIAFSSIEAQRLPELVSRILRVAESI